MKEHQSKTDMMDLLLRTGSTLRAQMPGGMGDQMGLHIIDCDPESNSAVFESAVPPTWMRNPLGWLHGGMIASLLDSSMGIHCAVYSGGAATPTINLNINYLRPTPADRPLYIRSRIVRHGRSMVFAEGSLWADDENNPCATATGVFHLPGKIGG